MGFLSDILFAGDALGCRKGDDVSVRRVTGQIYICSGAQHSLFGFGT